ncbi:hypothetical protein EJ08DRAFT_648191 [Tothia fuscella]|uniref:Uncharacterized protein n=1 Tax=Tothia fuscella TaxID=1048955 RepID=A0A9P4NW60_9PEZI|nr:hypothetical protein EJ08DRAFT_648191 [Tothia fuscella]
MKNHVEQVSRSTKKRTVKAYEAALRVIFYPFLLILVPQIVTWTADETGRHPWMRIICVLSRRSYRIHV